MPAVNDVVATSIAASVATATDLSIAPNVNELAVSTRVQSQYAGVTESASAAKPVIVELSSAIRYITTYQAAAGDTAQTIAAKFGISADSVKWANNLTGDAVAAGSTLDIVPVDGIIYVVKDGDTIEKIAEKYKANAQLIATYNDLELNGVTTGLKIIIPGGILPTEERPGYVAPQRAYSYGYSAGFSTGKTWFIKRGTPMFVGNKYAFGNCTAYAYDRRAEIGRPIPPEAWGNASTWDNNARNRGFLVNNTPEVGAIMQNEGGYGHVAIVEAILPNGDIQVSEMNASVAGGGFNIVSGRIIPAGSAHQYAYIH